MTGIFDRKSRVHPSKAATPTHYWTTPSRLVDDSLTQDGVDVQGEQSAFERASIYRALKTSSILAGATQAVLDDSQSTYHPISGWFFHLYIEVKIGCAWPEFELEEDLLELASEGGIVKRFAALWVGALICGAIVTPVARAAPSCFGQTATIVGTDAPEVINGTSSADVIVGLGGEDTIYGKGGNDQICGDSGGDSLYGQGGSDRVSGDSLTASAGCFFENDSIFGGPGNDNLYGGAEGDTVAGSTGNDVMDGGEDESCIFKDVVTYEAAPGPVAVNLATRTATGEGSDTLTDFEEVLGSSYADSVAGSGFPEILNGRAGADSLNGRGAADDLFGEDGDDRLFGGNNGSKPDRLFGGSGSDDHFAGPGDDQVFMGDDVEGNDFGDGGDGFDSCDPDPGDTAINCEA